MKQINSTLLSSVDKISGNSNIVIPYSITAVLCILTAVGHAFFYVQKLRNQRQKLEVRQVIINQGEKNVSELFRLIYAAVSTNPQNVSGTVDNETSSPYSPRTCGRGFFQYGLTLSIIFISYTFFIGGNDQTFSKFFFAYLKFEQFNISTSGASWGIILYWLSYSVCIDGMILNC